MVRKKDSKKAYAVVPKPNLIELVSKQKLQTPQEIPESLSETTAMISTRERVALLAYSYWVQRGRQGGSPEEDWFRAERELNLAASIRP